ncbi:MAG: cyclic nucleotide-binding domain-containing protein [Anaerolineaceae bacterium]|nr:cyclic nucleotide-binding domain-containing protein [Anaerolineaceae bacterium]
MADRFILSHVQKLPIFQKLPPDQLDLVVDQFVVLRYEEGEFIFRQGQRIPGMMLLISGQGTLTQTGMDGREQMVGQVSVNEYLNESALFIETTATLSLRAPETTIVLFLSRERMLRLLAEYPEIKNSLSMPGSRLPSMPGHQFSGQRENEQVVTVFHRHKWAFIRRLWLAAVPTGLMMFLAVVFSQSAALSASVAGLGIVIGGLMVVYFYLEWRNDSVAISDQRVVHIERNILMFRVSRSEIPLSSIQDVKAEVPPGDPFARILNYGTINIKTSGQGGNVRFDFIPAPQTVQNVIFTDQARFREKMATQSRNAIRGQVDDLVLHHPDEVNKSDQTAKKVNPIGGFTPLRMKFTNEKGETVYRKHYLIWLEHILLPSLVIFAGLVALIFNIFSQFIPDTLGLISDLLGLGVIGLGIALFYMADWDWRNDLYIVGDQTVTLIHKRPLFLQNEKDQFLLAQVDNVSFDLSGAMATLLRVGDVHLKLIGSAENTGKVLRKVYRPAQVQEEVTKRQQRARQMQQQRETQQRQQEILDYLSVYHERTSGEAPPASDTEFQTPSRTTQPVRDASRPPGIPRVRRDNPPH